MGTGLPRLPHSHCQLYTKLILLPNPLQFSTPLSTFLRKFAMSRWSLLKAAILGKIDDKSSLNDVSIHRFRGFEVIKKQKCIWKGFQLHVGLSTYKNLYDDIRDETYVIDNEIVDADCNNIIYGNILHSHRQSTFLSTIAQLQEFIGYSYKFLAAIDCAECLIIANFKGESSDLTRLIDMIEKGELRNIYRIKSIGGDIEETIPQDDQNSSASTCNQDQSNQHISNIEFYIQASTVYESSSRSYQYFTYELILKDITDSRHADEQCPELCLSEHLKLTKDSEKESEARNQRFSLHTPEDHSYRKIHILTKEPSLSNRVSCAGLFSHKLHGVDNTGYNPATFF